jgi:hypothetical protein
MERMNGRLIDPYFDGIQQLHEASFKTLINPLFVS